MKTFSPRFRKNFLACLMGPLAVIPASIVYALAFKIIEQSANTDNFELLPFMIMLGLFIAYPITLLVGLPISLLLQQMKMFTLVTLTAIVVLVISLLSIINGSKPLEFLFITYFSIWVSSACWYLHRVG